MLAEEVLAVSQVDLVVAKAVVVLVRVTKAEVVEQELGAEIMAAAEVAVLEKAVHTPTPADSLAPKVKVLTSRLCPLTKQL